MNLKELECIFIGSLINEPALYYRYLQDIGHSDYLNLEASKDVFLELEKLILKGNTIKVPKLKALCPDHLSFIETAVISSEVNEFDFYFNEIITNYKLEQNRRILSEALIKTNANDDPDEIVAEVIKSLQNTQQKSPIADVEYEKVLMTVYDSIIRRSENPNTLSGITSGYNDLDQLTDGLPKSLITVGARPGMGKTAMTLSQAMKQAEEGIFVLFFSLEMTIEQLICRLIATKLKLPYNKVMRGELTVQQKSELLNITEHLHKIPLRIVEGVYDISKIFNISLQINAAVPIGCIYIDYLQIISGGVGSNKHLKISDIIITLKQLASNKYCSCPVILLSQLNRGTEARTGKIPTLSDLKESGTIEEASDMIMLLYRPSYYDIKEDDNGNDISEQAQIIVAKNKFGEVKTLYRRFGYPFNEFENVTGFEPIKANIKDFDLNDYLPDRNQRGNLNDLQF